uniref:MD-2-related lipid-recognition domain-containing protein n=1 Tax=Anopheles culicifacies TaxID=139723 RepID=A0A182LUG8_9DIPT
MVHLKVLMFVLIVTQFPNVELNTRLLVKKFQCIDYPYEISKLHYCQLDTYRNGSQVAGVVVEIVKNLQKVFVSAGLYMQYFRTRTQLIATTLEYCQQTNNRWQTISNAATKFTLDYAQQHFPQLLTDCPLLGGQLFNVTGVRVEDSLIPSFALPGTYYVEMRTYNKRNQTVFSGWVEFDIK